MLRSGPRKLARWLCGGHPRRAAAVVTAGGLAAALTVARDLDRSGLRYPVQAAADLKQVSFPITKIRHVWIIELENTTFSQSSGRPSADPELAKVLTGQGALLRDYYGTGHDSLDN